MSMLAEPKRKQKWSLNPRGKAWSQDTSKFGQKLLEKMGWSQGKGLGANEDGRTEHIKVAYKNDSQGMGYKESDDQWTEHESNFTALLKALHGGDTQENSDFKLSSLEKKSESSKARVHYKKFTKGKDLSQYSEKDLANIFGKKSLKEIRMVKEEVEAMNDEREKDKNFSNAGLMSEYFKSKLPSFGKTNGYVVGNNGVLKKADDSESESERRPSFGFVFENSAEDRPSFGFGFKQEKTDIIEQTFSENTEKTKEPKQTYSFVSYISNNNVDEQISSKKKKNKKKRVLEEEVTNNEGTPTKKNKLEFKENEESSGKKKKDRTKKVQKDDTGLSNPAFDPLYTSVKVEKHVLDPIEESIDESLNNTLNDTLGQVADNFEVQVQIVNENTPIKRKEDNVEDTVSKKKKKKKDKINGLDKSKESEEESNINQLSSEEPKKKKKSKGVEDYKPEMDLSEDNSLSDYSISKKEKKKKLKIGDFDDSNPKSKENLAISPKKKKSKSKPEEGVENPFFNVSIEDDISMVEIAENPYEVKVQEKKKKKGDKNKENVGLENPIFSEEDVINSQDLLNEEYEVKRKDKSKKKKHKDKEEVKGLDNPALNLNDSTEESCDLMLNVVSTPVQITEDRNMSEQNMTIQKIREVSRRKSVRFSDVTRERIIPTKEEIENETLDDSRHIVEVQGKLNDSSDLTLIDKFIQKKKSKKRNKGVDNSAFDQQANNLEENITSISKTLDTYQAEIENDINEAKMKSVEVGDIMVGEVGNPDGTNEKLPDGTVKLKFKYANFKKTAKYLETLTGSKKSYKHLIKGDIVMSFKETNLHEIEGYASTSVS